MLLPPSMQDKTEFMPIGKAIQKPEPVKADPVREFEKHNHDIPGAKLSRVTPELAARALRSLCGADAVTIKNPAFGKWLDRRDSAPPHLKAHMEKREAEIYAGLTSLSPGDDVTTTCGRSYEVGDQMLGPGGRLVPFLGANDVTLTWPTLPGLPEPTFLPEVVNEAPSRDTEPLGDLAEKIKEAEERARVGSMVLEVERRLATYGFAQINLDDMNAMREWFGPLDIPAGWLGKISCMSEFKRMSI